VRLRSETKQGAYAARNRGVAASRGGILAFTDADCVPAADWLERMVAAVSAPGVELVLGGRRYNARSPALALATAHEEERSTYIFAAGESALAFGYTNNMAVRRGLFERRGPFWEVPRGADSVFVYRVMEYESPRVVRYVPDARVRHLEILTLTRWMRKKMIYGRVAEQMFRQGVRRHRDFTPAESREILRRTVRRNRYSRPQSLGLVMVVVAGMLCFRLGRLSARWLA
jgi:glycosyltransferase involved in cell wall biosynthesis